MVFAQGFPSYETRIFEIVKSKSEDISGISVIPKLQPDCLKSINGNGCAVMIIDPDKESHQLIRSALKHFSFRGENFDVLGAATMKSAFDQGLDNPSIPGACGYSQK